MPIISVTLPSDNTSANVADYNVPITTILSTLNGGLDDDNIASLSGTKLVAGTVPNTALDATSKQSWITGVTTPTSITYLGGRQFSMVYASSILSVRSVGYKNRYTRQVAAPTQVTQLSGTKYWSKATPNKFVFTTSCVIDVVINPTSYPAGVVTIASCYNGTSGWALRMNNLGQIQLIGYNGGAANFRQILSSSNVTIGRETRITAELDMATSTNTATTNYIMFDGQDVASVGSSGGTAPTTLVQAGNLNIGAENGGTNPFQGNISQCAIFGAKVTQATMRTYHGQGYTGAEASLNSAWSFNGVATDLNTTTPNDLTAQNSAGYATGGYFCNNGVSTTLEYSTTTAISSDGLTETVITPEGCMIPTSGGISAQAYSTAKLPYNYPLDESIQVTDYKNPYCFSAYCQTGKSITNTTLIVDLQVKELDPNNNFANSRYTAPVSGFYWIFGQVWTGSAGAGTTEWGEAQIWKNGSILFASERTPGDGTANRLIRNKVGKLIYLKAGDFIEMYAAFTGARDITAGQNYTYLSGFLVTQI